MDFGFTPKPLTTETLKMCVSSLAKYNFEIIHYHPMVDIMYNCVSQHSSLVEGTFAEDFAEGKSSDPASWKPLAGHGHTVLVAGPLLG